jgi:hypothetical protein
MTTSPFAWQLSAPLKNSSGFDVSLLKILDAHIGPLLRVEQSVLFTNIDALFENLETEDLRALKAEWVNQKDYLKTKTDLLIFLLEKVIPLARLANNENVTTRLLDVTKVIEERLGTRKALLLKTGHDDLCYDFIQRLHKTGYWDVAHLPIKSEPYTCRNNINYLTDNAIPSPFIPGVEPLKARLNHRIKMMAALGQSSGTSDERRKWYTPLIHFFNRFSKWIDWTVKGILAVGLIAAIAYISLQGASILSISLIAVAGISTAAAFVWPYCVQFYDWISGASSVKKAHHSKLLKETIVSAQKFILNDCLTRPGGLSDRDFQSLTKKIEFWDHSLTEISLFLSKQIRSPLIGPRKRNQMKMLDLSEMVQASRHDLAEALPQFCKNILELLKTELIDDPVRVGHSLTPMQLQELVAFIGRWGTDSQKDVVNQIVSFKKPLLDGLRGDFLSPGSELYDGTEANFGKLILNTSKVQDFTETVEKYLSPDVFRKFQALLESLKDPSIHSKASIFQYLASIFDNDTQLLEAQEAFSEFVFKSVHVFNPELTVFLQDLHKESICKIYIERQAHLLQMVKRFESAVADDAGLFTSDINEFQYLLNLSEIHATITGATPSVQQQFNETLNTLVSKYDGRTLKPIHEDILRCLPPSEGTQAKVIIAHRRFDSIIAACRDGTIDKIEFSRTDRRFMLAPKANIKKCFFEAIESGYLPQDKIDSFVRAAIPLGIIPIASYFAFEYIQSLEASHPLKGLSSSTHSLTRSTQDVSAFRGGIKALVEEMTTDIERCRTIADIEKKIEELIPSTAQFEMYAQLNPELAIDYFNENLSDFEEEIENDEGPNRKGFLERLSSIELGENNTPASFLPFLEKNIPTATDEMHRENEQTPSRTRPKHSKKENCKKKGIPFGDMSSISKEEFLKMCKSDISFALKAIRKKALFKLFRNIKDFCMEHPGLILDYLIMNLRIEKKQGKPIVSNAKATQMYGYLDIKSADALKKGLYLLAKSLKKSKDFRWEEIYHLTKPIFRAGKWTTHPNAYIASLLALESPERKRVIWQVMSNEPYGSRLRREVKNKLVSMVKNRNGECFNSASEYEDLYNMTQNLVGLEKTIEPDVLDLIAAFNIFYSERSVVRKFSLGIASAFKGIGSKHKPLANRALKYLLLIDTEQKKNIVNAVYDALEAIQPPQKVTDALDYIEATDFPDEVKGMFIFNKLIRRHCNEDALVRDREVLMSMLGKSCSSQDMLYYRSLCCPQQVSDVRVVRESIKEATKTLQLN